MVARKGRYTVFDRLLSREVGQDGKRYSDVRGIYGDRKWIEDMDIVNELDGHDGCVNALCWSKSGRLLASGSDDNRINIHSYHPESSTSQFSLTTSILTGHKRNIFSVKFMPYSNDGTIISATDGVRIFDIERSGHSIYGSFPPQSSSSGTNPQPTSRGRSFMEGITLTEGVTNAKVFQSHKETVKRIVTEDNPFYFLTCSEDGDVRQWDIRQPSKTYPPATATGAQKAPPPLISYSRYNLDLNTVSCSPSQPHYIALGGAHLHCFLHDRRMLGRDLLQERGGVWNGQDDALLGKATQCVKKFAPGGQQRMGRHDSGHITACKISDADPNELIVSWSGDWIYSFDILRSPDASEEAETSSQAVAGDRSRRVKDKGRKRKRPRSSGVFSQEAADRAGSRQRTESSRASVSHIPEDLSLRVNYENGQSEEIRIQPPASPMSEREAAGLRDTEHYRIARTTFRIQQKMFHLHSDSPAAIEDGPATHRSSFTSALSFASAILPEMDDISRSWHYPVDPNPVEVALQNRLREGRAASRRFVQAAGTLARVLGGRLMTGSNGDAIITRYFATVQPAPSERPPPRHEQFAYDFLKAILLWLDSGPGALVEGFSTASSNPRLPMSRDADVDDVEHVLIPYLLSLAGDGPIIDIDVSKFETDERRVLHDSEKGAVLAFARALKVPFADLTGPIVPASGSSSQHHAVQDRKTALDRWAFTVGRGILWNAAKHIRFASVDRAFGGRGVADGLLKAEERALRDKHEDIDTLQEDPAVVDAELVGRASARQSHDELASPEDDLSWFRRSISPVTPETTHANEDEIEFANEQEDESNSEDFEVEDDSDDDSFPQLEDEEDEEDEEDDEDDEDDEYDSEDEDGLSRTRSGHVLWRSDLDRSYIRERVEKDVPCAPHTKVFKGHCNVKTVKDVNYFGLQDEYVVSGSDSGHVFIWDRKTSQLLNILEGDREVVNVVQGHPYEPTMAVSGIDHTIKLFSPDAQEQRNARRGIGVHSVDPGMSSISFGLGMGRRNRPWASDHNASRETAQEASAESSDDDDDERVAPHGLKSRKCMHKEYEITSQNDMDRKGGQEDAYITRALLAQLAQRIHANNTDGDEDGEGEGGPILINTDDGCRVM